MIVAKLSVSEASSLLPIDLWTPLALAAPRLPSRWGAWLASTDSLLDAIARDARAPALIRIIEERLAFLSAEQRALLQVDSECCLQRGLEVWAAQRAYAYVETLVPDVTLDAQPWLADLGDRALADALAWRTDVDRGATDVAALPPTHPLAARALARHDAPVDGVWARRIVYRVAGAPLLVQEVFLPERKRR